jgi:hypothetical protein
VNGDDELRGRNRATVERYFRMEGQARLERYTLFTDDGAGGLWTTGQPVSGKGTEQLRAGDAWNAKYFPDWRWTDDRIYETQDPARFWVESGGEGHVHFLDHPVTFYRNHHIHTFVMADG